MSLNDFVVLEEIGNGTFGSVYKVLRFKDKEIYAMKKVNVSNLTQKEKENTLNEVRILASIVHENIISYKDAFYDEASTSICIIMEWADDSDLEKKIQQKIKTKTTFLESHIWSFLFQIVSALKVLHDKKIIHRDIKSSNVFLFKNGTVKIGDLNVSKIIKNGNLVYTQTGTPYYASPEVWNDKPYDFKSDMWSLGCVLYEICCLKPPFRGATLEGLFSKVIKGVYDPLPYIFSKELGSIVSSLLIIKPKIRPSCDQVLHIINKRLNIDKRMTNKENVQSKLLDTIIFPKNINMINFSLPKSKYSFDIEEVDINKTVNIQSLDQKRYLETKLKQEEYVSKIKRNEFEKENEKIFPERNLDQNIKLEVQEKKSKVQNLVNNYRLNSRNISSSKYSYTRNKQKENFEKGDRSYQPYDNKSENNNSNSNQSTPPKYKPLIIYEKSKNLYLPSVSPPKGVKKDPFLPNIKNNDKYLVRKVMKNSNDNSSFINKTTNNNSSNNSNNNINTQNNLVPDKNQRILSSIPKNKIPIKNKLDLIYSIENKSRLELPKSALQKRTDQIQNIKVNMIEDWNQVKLKEWKI